MALDANFDVRRAALFDPSDSIVGRLAAFGRVYYAFLGVPLPDGAKQVELSFRDRAYLRGRLITLAALAATATARVIGGLLGRRGRV